MKKYSTAKRLGHFLDESKPGATALRLGIHETRYEKADLSPNLIQRHSSFDIQEV